MTKILLIDTANLVCRAFFATYREGIPVLSHRGTPTNAIALWAGLVAPLVARERPDRTIFVSDGTPVYRRQIFPEYKGNRKAKPMEFILQQRLIDQVIKESGLEYAFDPDEEADDVIATLAASFSINADVRICSADKDFGQCVGPRVHHLKPMSESGWWPMDAAMVQAKVGVPPVMIAAYLALMGDVVDAIPGIAGIGPKNAVKILADLPSSEVIVSRIAAKKGWPLERAAAEFDLNLRLTTVRSVPSVTICRGDQPEVALDRMRDLLCVKSAAALESMLGGRPVMAPEMAGQMSLL